MMMRTLAILVLLQLASRTCLANVVNVTIHVYDASTLSLVPCRMLVETPVEIPRNT